MSAPATDTRKLVITLNPKSAGDLDWLADAEHVSMTVITNRALRAYRLLVEAQNAGASIAIQHPGADRTETLHLL